MVKNKMVKNLSPSPNTRSNKMRNMKQLTLTQQSLGTTRNNISAASNTQIYKGYCNSRRNEVITPPYSILNGDFSLTDLTGARFDYSRIDNANFTGSDLTNAKFKGNGCLNLVGANLTGTSIEGSSGNFFCKYFPLKSYIIFTKDRTTTCITPLGENESILINRMLTTDNDNWQFGITSYFNSLDIYKVLELDAIGFGLQNNNNNNRVSRFIFTNSLGKITITGSQLISSPTGINSNHIYLDSNNQLNITKPINDFVYGENKGGFKIRINIKQEATSEIKEGTASVILEYRAVGDTKSAPVSRCVINNSDSDCLNY